MDFVKRNMFGGGEIISVAVKWEARDLESSLHVKFLGDKFDNLHGYGYNFDTD